MFLIILVPITKALLNYYFLLYKFFKAIYIFQGYFITNCLHKIEKRLLQTNYFVRLQQPLILNV